MTCYNRKAMTLACLEALAAQILPVDVNVSVFLMDDGSTDGTSDAIRDRFPEATVLRGDGSLYWNGGMGVAFAEAARANFDFYLWLNDDTYLYPNALSTLLGAYSFTKRLGPQSIIVGSVVDPATGKHSYGGVSRHSAWRPVRFVPVLPESLPRQCDCMNGNCVLIPAAVAERVGNLSCEFRHGIGDFDYGLRARKAGCFVWIAPGYVASCKPNPRQGTWRDAKLPFMERWKKLLGPKGLPPREWFIFCLRHSGPLWPLTCTLPYLRLMASCVFPSLA